MKTILITGANGQLGSEIRYSSDFFSLLDVNFIFTDVDDLDISDSNALQKYFNENKIHYIVNCAAYTNVDKAESDIINAELINAVAVNNLASVSKIHNIPIIHISTDYVFNGKNNKPYKEDDETDPLTVYGRTKLQGEHSLQSAYNSIIIRTSWLYSKYGHNFVKTMMKFGEEKDTINVVNDQKGSPTNAADLADTILHILKLSIEDPTHFKAGIYHYSNEGVCTWYDFASEIMKQSDFKCEVLPVSSNEFPTPAQRPTYSLMDKTKIKKTFNLDIPHWKESLGNFIASYK